MHTQISLFEASFCILKLALRNNNQIWTPSEMPWVENCLNGANGISIKVLLTNWNISVYILSKTSFNTFFLYKRSQVELICFYSDDTVFSIWGWHSSLLREFSELAKWKTSGPKREGVFFLNLSSFLFWVYRSRNKWPDCVFQLQLKSPD